MNDNVPELWLRPHHLLCLQSFVGHGYSEEFVQQMSAVKQQLANTPDTPVKIVRGADMLCRHCPNCKMGTCTSDKPEIFNQLVLNILARSPQYRTADGLSATPELTVYEIPDDLSATPELTIYGIPESLTLSQALIEKCCPGCEWKDLCRKVIGGH